MTYTARITNDDGVTLFDMNDTTGFRIAPDATMQVAPPGDSPYITTLTLFSAAAPEVRRTQLAALGTALRAAATHAADSYSGDWYWFEFWDSGEEPRRALLYGGAYELGGNGGQVVQYGTGIAIADVALEHGPWESVEPITITLSGNALNTLPPLGDIPGRIAEFKAYNTGLNAVTALMAGIRPVNRGTTNAAAELQPGSLALFSAANVEQTLKTTDIATAITSSDYRHVEGRYLAVAEMGGDVSDVVTASVRIAIGSPDNNAGGPGVFQSGGWSTASLAKLGVIHIPPAGGGSNLTSAQIGDVAVYVYGTCYDPTSFGPTSKISPFYVHLIPADSYVYWEDLTQANSITYLRVDTLPNGETQLIDDTASQFTSLVPEIVNWQYPAEGGVMNAGVYETTTLNAITAVSGTLKVYPRWASYRTRTS